MTGIVGIGEIKRLIARASGSSGATDLGYTAATRELTSSTGTDVTLPLVGSDPGLMSAADKTKLDTGAGFVIENRTSDPGSPATGQIWLRTDI
jgi:hypothetical protein